MYTYVIIKFERLKIQLPATLAESITYTLYTVTHTYKPRLKCDTR